MNESYNLCQQLLIPISANRRKGFFLGHHFFLFGSTAKLRPLPTSGFSNLPVFLPILLILKDYAKVLMQD